MKLTYHRCGDYLLPALTIPDESVTLGKYGRMRKTYLKAHKPIVYNTLLLSGKLEPTAAAQLEIGAMMHTGAAVASMM